MAIALLAMPCAAFDARADEAVCTPVIEDGWIRQPPAPRPMLAGFGRIANRCADAVAVVSARSPAFGEVSLHETRVVDGVSRMRGIARLPIEARGEALLQPGGLHLMLMQPVDALGDGAHVPLFLRLEDGREIEGVLRLSPSAPGAPRGDSHTRR